MRDLLEHASGLPARLLDAPPQGRREFEHEICAMPLEYAPRTRSIYSDLGFILLGFLVADRGGALAAGTVRADHGPAEAGHYDRTDPRPTVWVAPDAIQPCQLRRFGASTRADAADGRGQPPRAGACRRGPRQLRRGARRRRRARRAVRHAPASAPSRARCCAPRAATRRCRRRSRRNSSRRFTAKTTRARQFARARLGYDAADLVVRHADVAARRSATSASPARRCGSIRRAIAISCCSPTASSAAARSTTCAPCAARFTTRSVMCNRGAARRREDVLAILRFRDVL